MVGSAWHCSTRLHTQRRTDGRGNRSIPIALTSFKPIGAKNLQNFPFTLGHVNADRIHKYLSRSNQLFCHITLSWQTDTLVDSTSMNEECVAVNAVQPQVDRQVCAVRFLTWEDVAPRHPTSPTKHTQNPMAGKIRDDWWVRPSHGEASGLRQLRFWIRVFLLLDRLPAKANEPCLPTHRPTDGKGDRPIRIAAVLIMSDVLILQWTDVGTDYNFSVATLHFQKSQDLVMIL